VVQAIVAERIDQSDAKKGFILDGFPRTVPQAVALDRMLKERGLTLDGVIELKVDSTILHQRIASRMAQAKARGEFLRSDDDPEKLKRRIEVYREQTAPLVDYYRWQGSLKSVDGMAPIPAVAQAIDQVLGAVPAKAATRAKAKPRPAQKAPAKRANATNGSSRAKGSKAAARKAAKPAKTPAKRGGRSAVARKPAGRKGLRGKR
jgi:adenylate kinase